MESYGAECVYVTDSAGALLPDQYRDRVTALRDALKPETEVGVHTHHNLALGIANAVAKAQSDTIWQPAGLRDNCPTIWSRGIQKAIQDGYCDNDYKPGTDAATWGATGAEAHA